MLLMSLGTSSGEALSSSTFIIEAIIERALAPWSTTRSRGPKQPRQGILALIQVSPHPVRVAGPQQITPCARKHFSGAILISKGLLIFFMDSFSCFDFFPGQDAQ